jgi:hypothetical protein
MRAGTALLDGMTRSTILGAFAIAIVEPELPTLHVPTFFHRKGEIPLGWAWCLRCERLVSLALCVDQVCGGRS